MKNRTLFLQRLLKAWKFQYGVLKSIFDWTIILYLVVPAVIIFSFIYRSWWIEMQPWIEDIPLFLLFFGLYTLSWFGNIRTYIEEADTIFLLKHFSLLAKTSDYKAYKATAF